jgi:hypothetical protein
LAKKALNWPWSNTQSHQIKISVEMLVYDDKLELAEKLLNELYAIEPTNEEIIFKKQTSALKETNKSS